MKNESSMVRWLRLTAPAALAILGMGCSHNPLVGTWNTAFTALGITGTTSIVVSSDGTMVVDVNGSGASCTGASTTTGYAWAATGASITFSGTPVCTGGITCGNLSLSCSGNQAFKAGSCTYALSNNDDTLALTGCTGTTDATYTRAN